MSTIVVSQEDGQAAPRVLLRGFEYRRVDVDGVPISCAIRGSGPPVLLLHGYPENHLAWRHVAPVLAGDHTVVVADLRGYGDSGKPAPDDAGLAYSKRSMARDQVGLMRRLGFERFQLAAHDRGARVAHRLVLDHPGTVTRLAILDIVPARESLRNLTLAFATVNYFWFFLAAGNGVPERLVAADPGYWVRNLAGQLLGKGASIEPAVLADYVRCLGDPETIAGSCADFRSMLGVDLAHDEETSAAGQKIECPLLVLWGTQSMGGTGTEPLSVWQRYAPDVRGHALPTGHFLPEEAPDLVSAALLDFLD
jgi:haloacetate dehalogenase